MVSLSVFCENKKTKFGFLKQLIDKQTLLLRCLPEMMLRLELSDKILEPPNCILLSILKKLTDCFSRPYFKY